MGFYDTLSSLGFDSYDAYLQSDHWQDFKRAYRKSRRPSRCAVCDSKRIELHHHTYVRLGVERLSDVTPLCREHHSAVHEWLKECKMPVERTPTAIAALRKLDRPEKRKKPRPVVVKVSVTVIVQPSTRKSRSEKNKRKKDRRRYRHQDERTTARGHGTVSRDCFGQGNWDDPLWAMQAIAAGLKRPLSS